MASGVAPRRGAPRSRAPRRMSISDVTLSRPRPGAGARTPAPPRRQGAPGPLLTVDELCGDPGMAAGGGGGGGGAGNGGVNTGPEREEGGAEVRGLGPKGVWMLGRAGRAGAYPVDGGAPAPGSMLFAPLCWCVPQVVSTSPPFGLSGHVGC